MHTFVMMSRGGIAGKVTSQHYFWTISISEALANGTYPSGAEELGRGAIRIDGMSPYKCAPVQKIVILVSMIFSRIVILRVFCERHVFGSIVEEGRHPGNTITARGSYRQEHSSLQQETLSDDDGGLDGLAADFIALAASPHIAGIPPTVRRKSSAASIGYLICYSRWIPFKSEVHLRESAFDVPGWTLDAPASFCRKQIGQASPAGCQDCDICRRERLQRSRRKA